MWPLLGIAVLAISFLIRLNPILGATLAAIAAGLAAGFDPYTVIAAFGKAFAANRYLSVPFIILPLIGLVETYGLQERARSIVKTLRHIKTGRMLFLYFLYRQISSAFGIAGLGGQASMVRPLLAPMAEATAEAEYGTVALKTIENIRAHAAASDTLAFFFGGDIFVATGSVLLIRSVLLSGGFDVPPLRIALWAIPTAILAALSYAVRMMLLDHHLASKAEIQDSSSERQ
jgi:uncharacterized membrane protein